MKSSIIESQFDWILNIHGEQWMQGQEIKGELTISNKSHDSHLITNPKLIIAYVDIKKFKALEEKSFREIHVIEMPNFAMTAKETKTMNWSYQLEMNSYITDKKNSLYLLWGDLSKKIPASLMLNISPHQNIMKVLEVWEIFFRFTKKECISLKDNFLEVKLLPPNSKEFATLESLKLKMKRIEKQLHIVATAEIKSIKADTTGMSVVKSVKNQEVIWDEKKYLLMPGHVNQDFLQSEIKKLIASSIGK
jgi:hypothetical protein